MAFFSLFCLKICFFLDCVATSLNDIIFLFDEQPASAAFTVISLSVACVHNINTSGSTPECERCKQCGLFDSFYFSFDKFK